MNHSIALLPVQVARHLVMGLAGLALDAAEAQFLQETQPAGIILFSRNISDYGQLRQLLASIHALTQGMTTIWIDQEGGRVQRLRMGLTRYPSPIRYGELAGRDREQAIRLARDAGRICGLELASLGIGVNCAPVLDLREDGAHGVIGERAFGRQPGEVLDLAGAWLAGLQSAGVMGMGKHFPGHGAAQVDSHRELPVVARDATALAAREWIPFRGLMPQLAAIMTAHLVVAGVDPDRPATWSERLLQGVLRQEWGYTGLIIADALEMGALSGTMDERARAAYHAGCDLVLCCTGKLADAQASLVGLFVAMQERGEVWIDRSRARVARILAGYRLPPGDLAGLLADPTYRRLRAEVESLADGAMAQDPTENVIALPHTTNLP